MRLDLLLIIRWLVPPEEEAPEEEAPEEEAPEEEAPEEEAAEVAVSLEFCIWYTWNLRFSQVHL